jgi:hypothetical protein
VFKGLRDDRVAELVPAGRGRSVSPLEPNERVWPQTKSANGLSRDWPDVVDLASVDEAGFPEDLGGPFRPLRRYQVKREFNFTRPFGERDKPISRHLASWNGDRAQDASSDEAGNQIADPSGERDAEQAEQPTGNTERR